MIEKLITKKFGEILYEIDEEDLHFIKNHKLYACKLSNDKLYIIRDDKKWLHRLIMSNCPKGMVIDHINGNSLDNTRKNLRITTQSINRQNTDKRILKNDDVLDILLSSSSNNELAKKYNCSNCLISNIRTGKLYSSIFPEILRTGQQLKKKFLDDDIRFILKSEYKKYYSKAVDNVSEIRKYKNKLEEIREIVKNSNQLPCTDFYADCENCKDETTDNGETCMQKGLKEIRSLVERI